MKQAKELRKINGWIADARLYQLSEPHQAYSIEGNEEYSYVIVSAVSVMGEPETYIFPAADSDADKAVSMSEMPGSMRGTLSHAEALANAGYEIVTEFSEAV